MKEEILELLRGQGERFVSGQEISRRLGVSRTAVWKAVGQLRSEGYLIESVTKNGYRLRGFPDRLAYGDLAPELRTEVFGRRVVHADAVGSTNDRAKRLAAEGAPEGTVVIAEAQTAGRGRVGRAWCSQNRRGVWMSLLLRPAAALSAVPFFTLLACAAAAETAAEIAPGVRIKWPNDVYLGGKKFCGVLTECGGEVERAEYVVVGIGVNVNEEAEDFPEPLREKATSLKLEAGRELSRKSFACGLLAAFERRYLRARGAGFAPGRFGEAAGVCGKAALCRRGGAEARAEVAAVDACGRPLLRFAGGGAPGPAADGDFILF